MENILSAISESGMLTVFPVHPRTRKSLVNYGLWDSLPSNLRVIEPLGYLDMLMLMGRAEKILTDSGGIQKEAYVLGSRITSGIQRNGSRHSTGAGICL